ncbi:hypothetical protein AJ78_00719 [Emergomyces pasteurianus Ep9510]|uniref:Uncharacterized protein n=1 Tax=Emergomyces pasteurianus Ep9510 TaxID=1447872 RepID=A0A1J9QVN6_9EURO|nr:hypothetical protein AJ78_00719 [Emergomyces pasteurianus Ep9510]
MSETGSSQLSDWEEDLPDNVRFRLPGFTLPLNWEPTPINTPLATPRSSMDGRTPRLHILHVQGIQRGRFPNALNYQDALDDNLRYPALTTRENTMVQIMNEITDRPNWNVKVSDDAIVDRWRKEMLSGNYGVSEAMAKWVIDELRYKTRIFHEYGLVDVFNGGVVKSDTAVPGSIKQELNAQAQRLEDVPENLKDYHSSTNKQVLNLVHPSLFPLVYGRSRILCEKILGLDDCIPSCGLGETLPVPRDKYTVFDEKLDNGSGWAGNFWEDKIYSQKFQWLPCNVEFLDEKGSYLPLDAKDPSKVAAASLATPCRITSYINNLHPQKHRDLYKTIEKVISCAIPLWNRTLSSLSAEYTRRINYDICIRESSLSPPREGAAGSKKSKRSVTKSGYVLPEPRKFEPTMTPSLSPGSVDLKKQYRKTGLQVIVKLANIHLTPENPKYDGGVWHVEGQLNEHICATALYYYDSQNITNSHVAFRQQCVTDPKIKNSRTKDTDFLPEIFGKHTLSSATQIPGSVQCSQGRLLTFPNTLQHRVEPFELADKSKPGHHKIIALYLVDPHIRIISTANVPPQRRDWWTEHLESTGALKKLPKEFVKMVFGSGNELDFPFSMEEAKRLRVELMAERTARVTEQDRHFRHREFSLCEN